MKPTSFQVGDKVTLAFNPGRLTIVPQLASGRVYCVGSVQLEWCEFLRCEVERITLVGVRSHRRLSIRQDDTLPIDYFRRLGRLSHRQDGQAKGGV